jgi:DNA-binding response OmpR family regulator
MRILIVEDEAKLAEGLKRGLESKGFAVDWIAESEKARTRILLYRDEYDLILLDLMLPGVDGATITREARKEGVTTPIIILTARDETEYKVELLNTGADDYLAKPFSTRELLARLRALVRRGRGSVGPRRDVIRVGDLEVSPRDYSASLGGRPLHLTTSEFVLLRVLAERAGRVLTREQLLDLTKGSAEEAFDRSIDAHISRLRHKLEEDPRHPRILRTVRGAGYLLVAGGEDGA